VILQSSSEVLGESWRTDTLCGSGLLPGQRPQHAAQVVDRTQMGAVHLATSPVADLQLIAALAVLGHAVLLSTAGMTGATTAVVVSLSGGAQLANLVSATMLVVDVVSSPGDSAAEHWPRGRAPATGAQSARTWA
jgi:hypothetical protein